MISRNNVGRRIIKVIIEKIMINDDKKIKYKYKFDNKLIIFIYYLKLFFIINYIIKLFYQIYLIYLII